MSMDTTVKKKTDRKNIKWRNQITINKILLTKCYMFSFIQAHPFCNMIWWNLCACRKLMLPWAPKLDDNTCSQNLLLPRTAKPAVVAMNRQTSCYYEHPNFLLPWSATLDVTMSSQTSCYHAKPNLMLLRVPELDVTMNSQTSCYAKHPNLTLPRVVKPYDAMSNHTWCYTRAKPAAIFHLMHESCFHLHGRRGEWRST
jgi:hypothetical protein